MGRTIDIRKHVEEKPITKIRITDGNPNVYRAELIEKFRDSGITVYDSATIASKKLLVKDKTHAENLIAGLQKAIELGWV